MNATRMSRGALMGSTLLAGLAFGGAAWAQAATAPANQLSEVVVTGTRIPRPNVDQAQPVAVLTRQVIDHAGPAILGDVIDQLPGVTTNGSLRTNSNNLGGRVGAGVAAIDLRGLGVSRTLVLVDGQRHVAGDIFSGAVDLNTIPSQLVDRVEVLTGGASAIYGSDAVSGVVNVILKKDFQGLQADVQAGGYSRGFGAQYQASLTAGGNLLDDRLNLTGSLFYNKQNGIWVRDVPGTNNYNTIDNPADLVGGPTANFYSSRGPIPNDGIPDRIYVRNVGSDLVAPNGVLLNPFTGQPVIAFDAAGRPIAPAPRSGYNSFAYGQLPADCQDCYFPDNYQQETSSLETKGTEIRANMDFTTRLHGFVDVKFVQTDTENAIQPSFTFGDFQLQPDNAFITPALAGALQGVPPQFYPLISRFINDGRVDDIRRRTWRIVAGLNGDVDAGFADVRWDGALNYGESDQRFAHHNLTILSNFAAALDSVIDPATGQPACRINVASAPPTGLGADALNPQACVPYNPFGRLNGRAAMDYAFGTFATHDTLTQQTATLNASFDTGRFFRLQGGPVSVAAGAEYRMERATERNDAALNAGLTENLTADASGGFNVAEGYVELNVPLFKDFTPGLNDLSFDAAYRGAHYSTVGGVNAYRFTGEYGPLSWVKFRTTYSQAIRAPNITEAFTPASPTFLAASDPCSAQNIQSNVNFAANCAAAGLPPGFVSTAPSSIAGRTSGNVNLEPEKSISYTAGVVIAPPMVPHLAVTFDYYSIKIKKAIYQLTAQDVVNNCYGGSAGLDPQYCSMLSRSSTTGNINFIETTYLNSAKLFTDGYELQVDYRANVAPLTRDLGYLSGLDGDLAFALTADYVKRLRYYPFQNNPSQVNVLEGTVNSSFGLNPQIKALATLTYNQGPVTFSWQTRYLGRMALFSRDPSSVDGSERLNIPYTPAETYHDINVRYRLDGRAHGTELFLGVRNLFNREDPFMLTSTPYNLDTAFDLGRFVFVGARYRR